MYVCVCKYTLCNEHLRNTVQLSYALRQIDDHLSLHYLTISHGASSINTYHIKIVILVQLLYVVHD